VRAIFTNALVSDGPGIVKEEEDRASSMTHDLLLPSRYEFTIDHCWRRGVVVSGVRRMNEVNARRARLVPGRVTVFGRVYHIGM